MFWLLSNIHRGWFQSWPRVTERNVDTVKRLGTTRISILHSIIGGEKYIFIHSFIHSLIYSFIHSFIMAFDNLKK